MTIISLLFQNYGNPNMRSDADEKDDVLVGHGSRTLAVSRVKPGGLLRRLQCWPTALALQPAGHGTPLATASVERREPRTLVPHFPRLSHALLV
jgi:hypothetical protein